MRTADCGLRTRGRHSGCKPMNACGFTYISLLAAIVILGITLGSATRYWSAVAARDREEELLFRGNQYRVAIERYLSAIPGRIQYPQSIDDLLKDSRTVEGRRYLRRKYKDPVTSEDFIEIVDPLSRRITGVRSSSEKEPIKKGNFSGDDREFEGKSKYSEWIFQVAPNKVPQQPGVIPGQKINPVIPPGAMPPPPPHPPF